MLLTDAVCLYASGTPMQLHLSRCGVGVQCFHLCKGLRATVCVCQVRSVMQRQRQLQAPPLCYLVVKSYVSLYCALWQCTVPRLWCCWGPMGTQCHVCMCASLSGVARSNLHQCCIEAVVWPCERVQCQITCCKMLKCAPVSKWILHGTGMQIACVTPIVVCCSCWLAHPWVVVLGGGVWRIRA